MNEDKETYDLFKKLSEITMISSQVAERIKDYSDVEVETVIFPLTFEMLQESMEGGD